MDRKINDFILGFVIISSLLSISKSKQSNIMANRVYYFWFLDTQNNRYKIQSIQECASMRGAKQTAAYRLMEYMFNNDPYVTKYGVTTDVNTHEVQMALNKLPFIHL